MSGLRVFSSQIFRSGVNAFKVSPCCGCHTKASSVNVKSYPASTWKESGLIRYGQPTAATHPHLLQQGEVLPGLTVEEFRERRHRLMETIGEFGKMYDHATSSHIVVIPSSTKVYMTEKIPYIFRQNTDFLYLSGCLEPDSALVLTTTSDRTLPDHISTMFVRKKDQHAELWDGPRTGVEGAVSLFGVDQALPLGELDHYLECLCKDLKSFVLWYDYMSPAHTEIHKTVRDFLGAVRHKILESPKPLIHRLRVAKSPAEIRLMKRSCEIASEAIAATIASSCPMITEHEIFARVDYECRTRGAEFLAYPPVVAGGNRANIIHYISNNQQVMAGEMVLMDAGCEYHGYSSDITRTWPVSGRFTDPQLSLYEAVLSVQTELIDQLKTRPTLDSLFQSMCQLLGRKLQELGILPSSYSEEQRSRAAYNFCPHHVSHYLGMDVHDTALMTRGLTLQPGMVVTVEPGIYISEDNRIAPEEFRGLGIRIEDDVLITDDGPIVLTAPCPKTVHELEKLFQK